MKNNILIMSLLALGLVSCTEKQTETTPTGTKDETSMKMEAPQVVLSKETKPVLFDYTSTGCPGCGSWGAPTFERIAAELKDNIVPVAVHIKYGDPMITDISEAIAANRTGQRFTPQLFVNGNNGVVLNGGRIDGTQSLTKIQNDLKSVADSETEIAVGVSSVINENVITLRYATQAYTELAGEYSLAVYVMEDELLYRQSNGATDPFEHNYVIRAANNGAFGTAISDESLRANATNEGTMDIELSEDWNTENLHATVIIWKKEGNNYVVVNANNNKIH